MNWFTTELDAVEDTWRRAENVRRAVWFAEGRIPGLVFEQTGLAIYDLVKGMVPFLLKMVAIVALPTAVGGVIGGVVGAVFGAGVGALPAGAAGATEGFELGLMLLEWYGIGCLIEYLGQTVHDLGEAVRLIGHGFKRAWGPPGQSSSFPHDGNAYKAADEIALGVAIIIRCIVMAIVAYLLAKGVGKAGERVPELVGKLKKSGLGKDFGEWVEKHHVELLENPKLKAEKPSAPPKPNGDGELVDASHWHRRPDEISPSKAEEPNPSAQQQSPTKENKTESKPAQGESGKNPEKENCPSGEKTCTGGEPISLVTGEELLQLGDFSFGGLIPQTWTRTYRSSNHENVGLGYGWTHPFSESVAVENKQVHFHDSEARTISFPMPAIGQSSTNRTEKLRLERTAEQVYRITPTSPGSPLTREFARVAGTTAPTGRAARSVRQ